MALKHKELFMEKGDHLTEPFRVSSSQASKNTDLEKSFNVSGVLETSFDSTGAVAPNQNFELCQKALHGVMNRRALMRDVEPLEEGSVLSKESVATDF